MRLENALFCQPPTQKHDHFLLSMRQAFLSHPVHPIPIPIECICGHRVFVVVSKHGTSLSARQQSADKYDVFHDYCLSGVLLEAWK